MQALQESDFNVLLSSEGTKLQIMDNNVRVLTIGPLRGSLMVNR